MTSLINKTNILVAFIRTLTPNKWTNWLVHVVLSLQPDVFIWRLTMSGTFTVRSLYLDHMNDHTRFLHKYICKIISLKIKIFMWFLYRKVLLARDNLAKINWHGSKKYYFCDQDESIQHLFITCHLAKIVWPSYVAFNFITTTTSLILLAIG